MYIPYIRMYIPKFRTEPQMAVGSGAHLQASAGGPSARCGLRHALMVAAG